jgi:hypothetical protein
MPTLSVVDWVEDFSFPYRVAVLLDRFEPIANVRVGDVICCDTAVGDGSASLPSHIAWAPLVVEKVALHRSRVGSKEVPRLVVAGHDLFTQQPHCVTVRCSHVVMPRYDERAWHVLDAASRRLVLCDAEASVVRHDVEVPPGLVASVEDMCGGGAELRVVVATCLGQETIVTITTAPDGGMPGQRTRSFDWCE